MKIVTVILFLLGLLFVGCKKYPEDETFLHLRSRKHRMNEKKSWHITEYKVNDVDSIPYINSKLEHPLQEYIMAWKGGFDIQTGGGIYVGFSENKDIVTCGYRVPSWGLTYTLMFDDINDWVVRRLENECLIIELFKNNKKYRIKFETV